MTISIHAPAKGATKLLDTFPYILPYFNPRSREGSDVERLFRFPVLRPISIHAPAKGATKRVFALGKYLHHFNPRSREGSDPEPDPEPEPLFPISIHAPAKGATSCDTHKRAHSY